MDTLGTVRLIAAVTSVAAAVMIALNVSSRPTVLGFGVFTAASIAWMIDPWLVGFGCLDVKTAIDPQRAVPNSC